MPLRLDGIVVALYYCLFVSMVMESPAKDDSKEEGKFSFENAPLPSFAPLAAAFRI